MNLKGLFGIVLECETTERVVYTNTNWKLQKRVTAEDVVDLTMGMFFYEILTIKQ